MRETIGVLLMLGWIGFWVWLRVARPETFRKLCGQMQNAVDNAAGAAADAVHREVKKREARKRLRPKAGTPGMLPAPEHEHQAPEAGSDRSSQ